MPFGKHRGQPLAEISSDYLRWCLSNFDDDREWLLADIRAVLAWRFAA